MYAKLVTTGDGCPPPGPDDCCFGGTPKANCVVKGLLPWGNCLAGYG